MRCALNEDLKEEEQVSGADQRARTNCFRDLEGDESGHGSRNPRPKDRSSYRQFSGSGNGDGFARPDLAAAQIVAAECVTLAETKDHLNWELIGQITKNAADESGVLKRAYDQVESEEDEHLYHTSGWTRELWIEALGMPAVLPPPEEEQDVKTAIEAAKAKKSRAKSA